MISNTVFSIVAIFMATAGAAIAVRIQREALSPLNAILFVALAILISEVLRELSNARLFQTILFWVLYFNAGLASVYALRARTKCRGLVGRGVLLMLGTFVAVSGLVLLVFQITAFSGF